MAEKNKYLTLSSGYKVPLIGLGTWKSKPGQVKAAVIAAIDAGYRHIDGAFAYSNEDEVGEAYKAKFDDGTVKREDLFVATKIWGHMNRPDKVERSLELSLQDLKLDYVDLLLMHSPMAVKHLDDRNVFPVGEDKKPLLDDIPYTDTWKAMEKLVEKGLAKSIGVSNFNVNQLKELDKIAKVPIAMNQVENHPCINQKELIEYCKSKNITITAYSPLGSPDRAWASDKDPIFVSIRLSKSWQKRKDAPPYSFLWHTISVRVSCAFLRV